MKKTRVVGTPVKVKFTEQEAYDLLVEAKIYLDMAHRALQNALSKEIIAHTDTKLSDITPSEIIVLSQKHLGIKAILYTMAKLEDGPVHEIERQLARHDD